MLWTDDELTVLLALFMSQPFSAGDDANRINARIATAIGRSRSAVDRQWRNVKYHLFRLDLYPAGADNVGQNVKKMVDRYRVNLAPLRRDALEIIEREDWDLPDLVNGEE